MRAAGYIRVSDDKQLDGPTLSAQRSEITRYCERHGYDLVHVYADEGISAYTDEVSKRPEFSRLLADAEAGRFDLVVVHTVDRWARWSSVQNATLERLGKAGVGFASISEQIDFTSPAGKLLLSTLGAVNEFSSAMTGLHVRKSQLERARQGLRSGSLPFGYRPGTPPTVVPEEGDAVRRVFELRASGSTYGACAAYLNRLGFKTRRGQPFSAHSMKEMFNVRFYTGVVRYDGEEFHGVHQPLIDEDLWNRVRARRHGPKRRRADRVHGALQGRARCIHCLRPLHAGHTRGGKPTYRERHAFLCKTKGRSVMAAGLDEQVGRIFSSIQLPKEWKSLIVKEALRSTPQDTLDRMYEEKRRLGKAYRMGAMTDREFESAIAEVDARIRASAPVYLPDVERAQRLVERLPDLWATADWSQRQRLLSPLLEAAYIDLATRSVEAVEPTDEMRPLLAQAVQGTGVGLVEARGHTSLTHLPPYVWLVRWSA